MDYLSLPYFFGFLAAVNKGFLTWIFKEKRPSGNLVETRSQLLNWQKTLYLKNGWMQTGRMGCKNKWISVREEHRGIPAMEKEILHGQVPAGRHTPGRTGKRKRFQGWLTGSVWPQAQPHCLSLPGKMKLCLLRDAGTYGYATGPKSGGTNCRGEYLRAGRL